MASTPFTFSHDMDKRDGLSPHNALLSEIGVVENLWTPNHLGKAQLRSTPKAISNAILLITKLCRCHSGGSKPVPLATIQNRA